METLNPDNPLQYAVNGEWEDLGVSQERISVADRMPVTMEILQTRHGIVVSDMPRQGKVLALRWDGLWNGDQLLALLRLNRAGRWKEFTEALRTFASPPLAFVYADVEDNIGFFPAGNIPMRLGFQGTVPLDGASGAFEWQGIIPHEMKPFVLNPKEGYIVSANQRVVAADAEFNLGQDQLAPFRAQRIEALLKSSNELRLEDMARIQRDQFDSSIEPILHPLMTI